MTAVHKGWIDRAMDQTIFALLLVFIVMSPIAHITSIKEISIYGAIGLFICRLFARRETLELRSPLLPPLAAFSVWAFVASFFSMDIANSLYSVVFHLFKYVAFYLVLVSTCSLKKRFYAVVWANIISSAIFSLGGLVYFYFIENHAFHKQFAQSFNEISINLVSVVTGTGAVLSFMILVQDSILWRRILAGLCLMLSLAATAMTESRAAVLSVMIAVFILMARNMKALIATIIVITLTLLVSPMYERFFEYGGHGRNYLDNYRIPLNWINTKVMLDHPWTGIGFGTEIYGRMIDFDAYNAQLPRVYQMDKENLSRHTKEPHNMILSIGARTGVPGLALFATFIGLYVLMSISLIRNGKNKWSRDWARGLLAASMFFLIIGLFEQGLSHVTETEFFTIIALSTIVWKNDRDGVSLAR